MTPQELAEGLRERLATIDGLRAYAEMVASPPPPAACVLGPTVNTDYDVSFDDDLSGLWTCVFEIEVFVNAADLGRAQQALRAYVSPTGTKSIPAALYADPTLGGRAQFSRVARVSRTPVLVDAAGGQLLSTALAAEVTALV